MVIFFQVYHSVICILLLPVSCLRRLTKKDNNKDQENNLGAPDDLPTQDVDPLCVVLQGRELSPENLQGLKNLAVLQVLQILLLQQQKLHTLRTKEARRTYWDQITKTNLWVVCVYICSCLYMCCQKVIPSFHHLSVSEYLLPNFASKAFLTKQLCKSAGY